MSEDAGRVFEPGGSDAVSAQTGRGFPPARFALIYESKDGRLCLFEDADGHLTAVRAEKLA